MNIQLTNYGVELLQGSIPFKITKYELGSAYNYSPSLDASSLEGELVYSGSPTDPIVINANTIKYSIALGYTVGDFTFGEIALYVEDKCVALVVSDSPVTKQKYSSAKQGNALVLDIYIGMTGRNYYAWVDELKNSSEFEIPTIESVDYLPPPSKSSPNFYIISAPSLEASTTLAYTTNIGIWNFDVYQYSSVKQLKIIDSTSTSITFDFGNLSKEEIRALSPKYFGESIVQFYVSSIPGICRNILQTIQDEKGLTVYFATPLAKLPNKEDTVLVYARVGNSFVEDFELPVATSTTLGGIKVGEGLQVSSDGTLSSSISENEINNSIKKLLGVPGGIASLTDLPENASEQQELESTRLPERNLTVGALYMPDGTWDASTNSINGDASYKLVSGGKIMYKKASTVYVPYACRGYVLEVGVSGNTEIDGISNWQAGDLILSTGKVWRKISGSQGGISGGLSIPNKSSLVYYESSNQSTRGLEIKSNSLDVSIDTNINIELPENESITPGIYSSVMVNKNGIIIEASNIVRGGNF